MASAVELGTEYKLIDTMLLERVWPEVIDLSAHPDFVTVKNSSPIAAGTAAKSRIIFN